MKKILWVGLALVAVFVLVLAFNTVTYTSKQVAVPVVETIDVDEAAVCIRLSQSVRLPTISHQDSSNFDPAPFLGFRKLLETNYPRAHQALERRIINDYSLLYEWRGGDSTLKPAVIIAHIDVVPVEPGTEPEWDHAPFGGEIADGYIWGRGAMDMKSTLISVMEAVEALLHYGFAPQRTIYLAFGHDEEIGGANGAAQIAAHLNERGVHVAFTIDEGMAIVSAEMSPAKRPTGIIGIAEKGYVTLRLTAKGQGGHSSMPPSSTTLGILARAIVALEKYQMPASFSGPIELFFDSLGPEMPTIQKALFANRWVFEGMLVGQLEEVGIMNALLRTTTAATMISGGVKENVLPSQAHAYVNFRLLPGDTVDDVVAHANDVIANADVVVSIHRDVSIEASPVASADAFGFHAIEKSIREVFEDTLVAPGMVLGGTDTKHFVPISDNSYRFFPLIVGSTDMVRIHGTNERVSIDNYVKMIKFHAQFIRNVSAAE